MMSTPFFSTARASSTVATMAITLMPRSWQRRTIAGTGLPSPIDHTGTRSSRITSNSASMRSGMPGAGPSTAGMPSRSRKTLSSCCTARIVVGGTRAGSAGGRSSVCSHWLTPNGRSVTERTWRIRLRSSSDVTPRPATMPSPPARDTSAASSGPAALPMPDCTIGYSMPSRSQSAVRRLIGRTPSAPARAASRAAPCRRAGSACAARRRRSGRRAGS